ncbi:pyridoxamine 5'-phosphate oxidase family protein [Bradyrhizobium sp. AUGA SZCCT0051]|nr:pyridoxamine 5'-phosphate oxidase family protein [Bradyrhizobium sp. AUGA SZCCT0124]MBR1316969.1 pyridoxamine 5'-phosphate oxidase family protein [Bradyrhizobium sp. AUGA SZCCT0051]MBR1345235.1 pyridoxamine 5'-phosphate oxidase family protein [Bradyrhizobium sp. AUGA SZCCT0105]MBR1360063.1 pyridoxamine 5'-phosphate oxidase family protein [Bradyrhizobium sp. AUGA SZCCT0045]
MAGIDIAILSTHAENGEIANRPMSNNGDVAYDGTSYYFSYEQARAISDIERNPKVALGFSSEAGLFSQGIYVAVEGAAELIRDKAVFRQHWTSDLDKWFANGVDTPGIVLIKVKANRATYWKGREEGESVL